ncbi:metallophosphoesterase [Bacteroides sp.]|uniref:metallophosphoesterase n=1 Tax=Bacteroides sp. TaxID=29523 RepID=UPI00260C99B6|nr:metallophosphoesterase [Bacteroides sp.]MDD3037526.1 metallophosphoesterase [Bacteroides sp.]
MLQRLFIFLLIFLVLPDIYLYLRFIVKLTSKLWLRLLYWLPCFLLSSGLAYLTYFGNDPLAEKHTQGIGWFSIFFFLFTAPKLILAFFTFIGIPFHKWLRWPRTPFICTGLTLGVLCIIVIIYGSFIGRTQFDVKEVTYTSSRLPQAFEGYRIVQLSDIHIGSWQGNTSAIQKLVNLVNEQHPDLIVFTGDLVNHRAVELEDFQKILASLKAKDGVYSILGNHDYGPYFHWENGQKQAENLLDLKQRKATMGWKLLNNEHDILVQGNDSIALIGVENEGEPPFSQHGDLPKAMQGTEGMFQILLSHNPTHWRREVLPQSNIDLMLAGHTHGMQMKLGDYSLASYIYPEWCGMYLEGSRGLYVNLGIGYVGLPFRFGAWPEITVLTLRR